MIDLNLAIHKALSYDGFGRLIRQLSHAMLLSGQFDVHVYLMEMLEWPGWMQNAAGLNHAHPTLFLCPPNWIKKPAPSRTWLYAMHESSQLPAGWAEITNQGAEHLIVPCEWCEQVYRESGVKLPISVVHPGVDFDECALLLPVRTGTRPYTFLALGDRGMRKGWELAYLAFFMAFRPDDQVSLIIKTNLNADLRQMLHQQQAYGALDRRVRLWTERVDDIRDIFAQADCLAYPAHGEGWGLFPREAAACGLPVIATNYSGLAVNCEQWAYPLNDYQLTPAPGEIEGLPGMWAMPDIEALAHQMRWCYDHQDEARAKGQQAARWLRQNATWEASINRLAEVFTQPDRERQQIEQRRQEAEQHGGVPLTLLKEVRDQQFARANGKVKINALQ